MQKNKIELTATCLFGLEALVAKEVKLLGYDIKKTENCKVIYLGDEKAICRSNMWLRTAERVLVNLGDFDALSYDDLFEGTKALPWEEWITENAAFPVKGYSLNSKLHSVPDCQSIIKKAVVERLRQKYHTSWFKEDGPIYQIQFSLYKNKVFLMIDTSGEGLHKRGYREHAVEAPLKETLAAGIVMLSFWNPGKTLIDPFCGSGTIPIEAALIGANIAPGIEREFSAQHWNRVPKELWWEARKEAHEKIKSDITLKIYGFDISAKAIGLSRQNAELAGVDEHIRFEECNMKDFRTEEAYGCIISNPPYGERLGEKREVERLYVSLGKKLKQLSTWSYFILAPDEGFEGYFGRKANKKRKLYNGMLKCNLYQFFGPKPIK